MSVFLPTMLFLKASHFVFSLSIKQTRLIIRAAVKIKTAKASIEAKSSVQSKSIERINQIGLNTMLDYRNITKNLDTTTPEPMVPPMETVSVKTSLTDL